jgi:adhesin/invasin
MRTHHALRTSVPRCAVIIGLAALASVPLRAQSYGTIKTFAGNGTPGFSGDNAQATAAQLNSPRNVDVDASGNIYVSDSLNNRIRKIAKNGVITTYAGGGSGADALNQPRGIVFDPQGNLYIADSGNNRVRKVAPNGTASTVAGTGTQGSGGDGGPATNAQLNNPYGLTFESGNLYIADAYNFKIRKVDSTGKITTYAGTGTSGSGGDGDQATKATFMQPYALAVDAAGNLYVADVNAHKIRKITKATGVITTFAGTGNPNYAGDGGPASNAFINGPAGMVFDATGNMFFADLNNNRVRKIDASGIISTVAGNGSNSYTNDGEYSLNAGIGSPIDVGLDSSGALYVAQRDFHVVRAMGEFLPQPDSIVVVSGTPQSATVATGFAQPLIVRVLDKHSNVLKDVTVTFTKPASGASATLSASTAVTDQNGQASITATANTIAGAYQVSASVSGVATPAVFSLTNVAGAPSQIVFVTQPGNTPAGSTINAVTVQVSGPYGNPNAGVTVTMTAQGGAGTLMGTTTGTTDSNGQVTFNSLKINTTGTYQLKATAASITQTSNSFNITAATSRTITVLSGSGQTAAVGAAYAAPLKATVLDAFNNPVAGASVTFTAPSSGASVTFGGSTTVTTNGDGVATSPALTANSQSGAFQATASTSGAGTPASFNLTNTTGAANKLKFVQQPSNTAAGATIAPPVTVQLQDSFGNSVATPGVAVTVTLNPVTQRFLAIAGTTTQNTNSSGLATFNNLSVAQAGTYQLAATSGTITSAQSNTFIIAAGAPASIAAVGGTPQSATISTAFANPLQVLVKDALNNPVSGVVVSFSAPSTGASATLSAGTATTNASGVASVTATANSLAGSYSVTASAAGTATFVLTNVAGGTGRIAFLQQPVSTTAGAIISAVTVKVTDSGGNALSGVIVTLSAQGGTGTLQGTVTGTTDVNGTASYNNLKITVAGTYRLQAAAGAVTELSNSFQITAAAAANINVFDGNGQTAAVSTAYAPLRAIVTDAFQNPIANAEVVFHAPASGASVTFAGSTTVDTDTQGIAASPTPTANQTPGAFQVTATTSGAAQPATFNLTNAAGTANKLAFVQQPTNTTAGQVITPPVTVQLLDSFGNPAPQAGVTVSMQVSPVVGVSRALLGTLTANTDSNGLATFANISVAQAGTYKLTAQASGITSAYSNPFNVTVGPAGAIQATGGTPQTAAIQTAFVDALQATVTDSQGNPVSGVTVAFSAPSTGASATLSAGSAATDTSGHARVNATANSVTGSYTVTASVAGVTGSATFSLRNTAGSAANLVFVQQPASTTAGATISAVSVQVTDSGSNPIAGATVTLSAQGGNGTLQGTVTGTTDATGTATFNDLRISVTGTYQLKAVSGALTATSATFQIRAAAATNIVVFDGNGQAEAVGTAYTPLEASVEDAFGNPVPNAEVTFSAPGNGASVTFDGSPVVTTNALGVAASPVPTANGTPGTFQVTATTPGAPVPATFNLTNTTGTAGKLAFVQQPIDTVAGQPITPPVTVQVEDSFGNPVATAGINVTLQASPLLTRYRTIRGTITEATDATGLATFAGISFDQAGRYRLRAQAADISTALSSPFTVTAGAAASVQTSGGTPQSTVVLTAFADALQVVVKDSLGNAASGATVTFTAPSTGASVTLSAATATTDSSGHASVTATANSKGGGYTVTATVAGAGSAAFTLTNVAGEPSTLAFEQQPTNTQAGSSISTVKVSLLDAGGNPVPGVRVTMTTPPYSGRLTGTTAVTTDASGEAVFNDLKISIAGTYKLQATAGSISALSNSFQITPATSNLQIVAADGGGQSATVNTAYAAPLIALVQDTFGNAVPNATVTFAVPGSGASATFGGATAVTTNGQGIATSPVLTANAQAGAFQATASTAGAATAAAFNLTNLAGIASKLAFVQQPTNAIAGQTITPPVTVQIQDSQGNPVSQGGVLVSVQTSGVTRRLRSLSGTTTQPTNGSGLAVFAGLSESQAGTYTLLATASGFSSATSNLFTIAAGAPGVVQATGGTPQTTVILTAFGHALQATVTDAVGNPLTGVTVTFAAPPTGASATLSAASATTDSAGHASVNATANSTAGSYTVTADVSGVSGAANFALTNVADGASALSFVQQPTSTTAGATISGVTVKVTDSGNNPVSGVTVTLSAQGGGGSLGGTVTGTTDITGTASFDDLTITTAGTYQLQAVAGTLAALSDTFQIAPAAAVNISVFGGNGQTKSVGADFEPLRASVQDQYGNAIAGAAVTFSAPASGASVTFASDATVATNALGIAASPVPTANGTPGAFQVTATTSGASPPATFNLTNVTGAANKLGFVQQPTDATAGQAIAPPVTVQLQDSFGNAVATAGVNVSLQETALTSRRRSLRAVQMATTDATGLATFPDITISLAGTYTLSAQASGINSATSDPFQVSAGAAAKIQASSGTPQTTTILTAFPEPLEVAVVDGFGNPVGGLTVPFTVALSGASATLSSSTAVTDANGNASVIATANSIAGSYIVRGTISGSIAIFELTNAAGGVSTLQFTQQPTNTKAGATIGPVSVMLADGSGNPVPGIDVTVTIPGSSVVLNGTTTVATDGSGVARFNDLNITVTGTYRLQATASGVSKLSESFDITPATSSLTLTVVDGDGQKTIVNTAYSGPLKVLLQDSFGNNVTGAAVTFTAPGSGASVTFGGAATVTTDSDGVATSPGLTANSQAGALQVTAGATGASLATFNLTNLAGASSKLAFRQQPTNTLAGATITPAVTVQLEDSSGNPVAQAGVPVALQVNSVVTRFRGARAIAQQLTDTNGLATFPTLSINQAGTYTLMASTTGDIASATSAQFTISAGTAATIQATGGASQSTAIDTPFGAALQATVTDALGNPVGGVAVTFSVPSGGASAKLSAASATTDSSGHASVTATANSIAGSYTAAASAAGVTGTAGFALTNTAGPATNLAFAQQPASTTAGATIGTVTVQATDSGGNPVSGVTVTMSAVGGSGTLQGTVTGTTDATGTAAFDNLQITATGTYQLRADAAGASPALSNSFEIAPAADVNITAFDGGGQMATVGTAYLPLRASVTDRFGNPVANVQVTFSAPGSGASVTFADSPTVVTDGQGLATSPVPTANNIAGQVMVTASTSGAPTAATFTLTNTAATANKLTFGQQPSDTTAGVAIAPPVTVQIEDSFGNPVHMGGVSVSLQARPVATRFRTIRGAATVNTDANGLATFDSLTLDNAGKYTLLAEAAGIDSAGSNAFTVNAAGAASIEATGGTPQTAAVQAAFSQPLQATVKDAFGNPVSGATVNFSAPASGATAALSGASGTTDSNGNASVTATANAVAGSYMVTAALAGKAGISATFALTNSAGGASALTFTRQPANTTAGATMSPVEVKLTDGLGNPVSGITVTMAIPAQPGVLQGTLTANTGADGLATFGDLHIDVTGTYALEASEGAVSKQSNSFQITPATSGQRITVVSGSGQSAPVTTAYGAALKAKVQDMFGNNVPGASVTFAAPGSGPSVTFGGPATVTTDSEGNAISPTFTANSQAGTFQATATTAGASTSANFTLTNVAGSANKLGFTQQPADTVAGQPITPAVSVQLLDSAGNPVSQSGVAVTLQSQGVTRALRGLGGSTTQTTNDAGLAVFAGLSESQAGVYTLLASATGIGSATSKTFTVTASAAALVKATGGTPQAAMAGTAFGDALQATVTDSLGNAVSGATVTFTAPSTGASATLSAGTAATDATGVARVTATANTVAGGYSVTASIAGGGTAAFALTNTAGAVMSLAFVQQPAATAAGTPLNLVSVRAADSANNPAGGIVVTLNAQGGTGTLQGTVTGTTDITGTATFSDLVISTTGTYTLRAVAGTATATSAPFEITPATAANISVVAGDGQSAAVGTAYAPLVASVTDAYQNPVANAQVTFTAPTTGASVTFGGTATVTTNQAGIASSPIPTANQTPGAFQATATTPGGSTAAKFNLTNITGAANRLAFVQQPTNTIAGQAITPAVTVQVQDSFGNPVSIQGVNVMLQETPLNTRARAALRGVITAPTGPTGLATFQNVVISQAGTYTLTATAAGYASATSGAFNITAGAASSVQATGGTPQSATILTPFTQVLQATVKDSLGNPVAGVTVGFSAPGSGASAVLSAASAITDVSGNASVNAAANSIAGSYAVTATIAGSSASFLLTNAGGGTSTLAFVQQPAGGTAGATIGTVTVKLADTGGNGVAGIAVRMTIPGGAAVLNGTTIVATDANGIATFNNLSIDTTGTYQLQATAGTVSGTSNSFQVSPSTDRTISVVSGDGQSTPVGSSYGSTLKASVRDPFGNAVPGASVTFAAPANGASVAFAGANTVTADSQGIATSPPMTANSQTGSFAVTVATAGTGGPATYHLTNVAAAANRLTFVQQPTNAAANQTIMPTVTVQVQDASGNPVADAGVVVTLNLSGQGGGTPAAATTDATGLASFPGFSVAQAGTYTVQAQASGLASAQSGTFTIAAGPPVGIQTAGGTPQSTIVSAPYPQPLQIMVSDASGNPVSGVAVLFQAPGSGASGTFGGAASLTVITDAQGRALAQFTANNSAGVFVVTATAPAVTGSAQFALANLPSTPPRLAIVQQPGNAIAGQAIAPPVTVQVEDTAGNPVATAGIAVLMTLSAGTGVLSGTVVQTTNASGLATFSDLSIDQIGTKQLRAISTEQTPAVSNTFEVAPAPISQTVPVFGSPQAAEQLQPFNTPLQVRVTDALGNPVAGAPVSFNAPSSGPSGSFGGPATVATDSNGIATSPVLTANSTTGNFNVTATVQGGPPALFSLTILPATTGILQVQPAQLSFTSEIGQSAPAAQSVQISANNGSVAAWAASSSAPWLTVTPAQGVTPGIANVQVNPAGLATGTYSATITVSNAGGQTSIFVTYRIADKPGLVAAPSSLGFLTLRDVTPPALIVQVTSSGRPIGYTATISVTTPAGGNWLQVSNVTGQTPGTATVSANPTGLAEGIYNGVVTFTPSESGLNGAQTAVTLLVGPTSPTPLIRSVVNAGSFHPGGAPGALMTIFGSSLSDAVYQASTLPLPTSLGPTTVTVNGTKAPLYYVSPGQINFQMPSGVKAGTVQLTVTNGALQGSADSAVGLASFDPGMFVEADGRAAALNQNLSVHTPATPQPAGALIIVFATGQGPTTPSIGDGTGAPASPLSYVNAPVAAQIGGKAAQVVFAGLAPGFVGNTQFNLIIPQGLAPGDQPVVVTINGVTSNAGLISVR